MISINIPVEVSMLLNPLQGIDLYFGEDEIPSHSVTILELVSEWIGNVGIYEESVSEAETLITQLREAIALVTESLPK